MSEQVATEQPDLSSLTGSPPGSKRKRDLDSPGQQRPKRATPSANMSVTAHDTAAYIESAIEATQAAAAANGVNVADFNALQQAAQEGNEATDAANATSTAQAALGMYPTLHVPPSTEEQFAAQAAAESSEQSHEPSFGTPEVNQADSITEEQHAPSQQPSNGVQQPQPQPQRYIATGSGTPKPTVGSEEWHKMRKDNHKEGKPPIPRDERSLTKHGFCANYLQTVERRRRETINEGINELAKIVPGCEKNKGSILQRAVSFISQLKENEQQNIEKWTLEKLLTEQAITELSTSNDKLKQECERLYRELETWKRIAQNAGLEPPQPKEEPSAAAQS